MQLNIRGSCETNNTRTFTEKKLGLNQKNIYTRKENFSCAKKYYIVRIKTNICLIQCLFLFPVDIQITGIAALFSLIFFFFRALFSVRNTELYKVFC